MSPKENYRAAIRFDRPEYVPLGSGPISHAFQFEGNFLLFSPSAYRQQLLPYHKQVVDCFHSKGLPVILHSCGNITGLADALVEAGFDCLQPLEVKAGVDLARLVQEYGRDVCFMGGVDVRALSAPEEVEMEREVKANLDIGMSSPGGYVFHSDHSIPNQVSFARYGRVAQLVREYGVYD